MNRFLVWPVAGVVAGVMLAGCGSGSGSDGSGTSAPPTSSKPSTSDSKSPSKSASTSSSPSASTSPSSASPTAVVTRPIPVVFPSNAEVVGDWIVGVPSESSAGGSASFRLRGFNWKTGKTWEVTPLVGLTPARNPGEVPELSQESGSIRFAYESSIKGQGLNADQNAAQVVTLDASTGKIVTSCSPDLTLGQMFSVDAGPALYSTNQGVTRLDATTCAPTWPAKKEITSGLELSNGAVIITSEVSAVDAATGETIWNEETADFATSVYDTLGLTGGLVVFGESKALTYRDINTGALQGNSVAAGSSNTLDQSNGRVYTFGQGTLTAYDVGGVQAWQRAGLDPNAQIQDACQGRLWVKDSRTDDIFLLQGATGNEVAPNSEVPVLCLDDKTGIYASSSDSYSGTYVVKALPSLTTGASPTGSAGTSGSASASSSAPASARVSGSATSSGSG